MIAKTEQLVSERLQASPLQIAEVCQRWKIVELALFGSVLRDDFRPDSDIDVLVTFSPDAHLSLFDLVHLQDEFKNLFQRETDVVSHQSIQESKNYLRRQRILTSAKIIYSEFPQAALEELKISLEPSGTFTAMDRDRSLLLDMILAGRKIQQYVSGVTWEDFQNSTLIQDASVRQLEIIGEAARRLSQPTRDSQPDIPWSAIISLRNRLIHEYSRVDLTIVWEVICHELPDFIEKIESLIPLP
jgi:hypothetical protein